MSKLNAIRVAYEDLREAAFGAIGAAYAIVGTATQNPIRIITIVNDTDAPVVISFNGVDDHIYVPATSGFTYDYNANKQDPSGIFQQPSGTEIYVKRHAGAPTTGDLAITIIYASPN